MPTASSPFCRGKVIVWGFGRLHCSMLCVRLTLVWYKRSFNMKLTVINRQFLLLLGTNTANFHHETKNIAAPGTQTYPFNGFFSCLTLYLCFKYVCNEMFKTLLLLTISFYCVSTSRSMSRFLIRGETENRPVCYHIALRIAFINIEVLVQFLYLASSNCLTWLDELQLAFAD